MIGSFRKLGVPCFAILVMRILLFRVITMFGRLYSYFQKPPNGPPRIWVCCKDLGFVYVGLS